MPNTREFIRYKSFFFSSKRHARILLKEQPCNLLHNYGRTMLQLGMSYQRRAELPEWRLSTFSVAFLFEYYVPSSIASLGSLLLLRRGTGVLEYRKLFHIAWHARLRLN